MSLVAKKAQVSDVFEYADTIFYKWVLRRY
jgi:hypothetical protein